MLIYSSQHLERWLIQLRFIKAHIKDTKLWREGGGEKGDLREREKGTDRISQGSDQISEVFMKAESHDTPVPLLGADRHLLSVFSQ